MTFKYCCICISIFWCEISKSTIRTYKMPGCLRKQIPHLPTHAPSEPSGFLQNIVRFIYSMEAKKCVYYSNELHLLHSKT